MLTCRRPEFLSWQMGRVTPREPTLEISSLGERSDAPDPSP